MNEIREISSIIACFYYLIFFFYFIGYYSGTIEERQVSNKRCVDYINTMREINED